MLTPSTDTTGPETTDTYLTDELRAEINDDLMYIIDKIEERLRLQAEHEEWDRTIRTPATYRSEGPRIIRIGSCKAEYEIAHLADGRWVMTGDFRTSTGGGGCGYEVYGTREEAVAGFVDAALRRFSPERQGPFMNKAESDTIPRMIERLSRATLFGFEEPDPLPCEEWYPQMIAFEVGSVARSASWELLDVVRGMDVGDLGKDGSFFGIPTPWDRKRPKRPRDGDEDGE